MKRHLLRAGAAGLTVLAASALLVACTTGAGGEDGTSLTLAVQTDPTCIDPQQPTVTQALYIGRQVVDSLVDQDPETGEIVPWLAESFEANDALTAFTFTLRDGVTFSDTTALTSDVVKANFDAIMAMAKDGATAALASQYLAGYQGVTIADERTFTVNFAAANTTFLAGAATMSLGLVSQESTTLDPQTRCQSGVVGTGPFVYDHYTPNNEVSLDRRKDYDWPSALREHTGPANLSHVDVIVIAENSVRVGGLQSGEFGMIGELPYLDAQRIEDAGFPVYAKANPGIPTSLIPNLNNPVLADPAVREAIQASIDRTEIRDTVGYPDGNPPESALSSGTQGFTSNADLLTFDAKRAASVLDAAGWTREGNGVREKDGQKLTFTVTGFYDPSTMELIQLQLRKVGIDMQINFTDPGGFFGAIAEGKYDMLFAALTRTGPDALPVLFDQTNASHWAVFDDPALQQKLTAQLSTTDPEARQAIIAEVQHDVLAAGYLFPILEVYQVHASRQNVSGLEFDAASRFHLYDVKVEKK